MSDNLIKIEYQGNNSGSVFEEDIEFEYTGNTFNYNN